jgi:hypothetical protein
LQVKSSNFFPFSTIFCATEDAVGGAFVDAIVDAIVGGLLERSPPTPLQELSGKK